jgi:hypothetical protein
MTFVQSPMSSSCVLALALIASAPSTVRAQGGDVQQQLSNPISSLTLLPIQANCDRGWGQREMATTRLQNNR